MVRLRYKSTSRHPQSLLEIASPPWPRPREPASPLPSNQHPPPSPPSTDWIKHRSAAQPPPPEPTASLSTTLSNRSRHLHHPPSQVPLNTYSPLARASPPRLAPWSGDLGIAFSPCLTHVIPQGLIFESICSLKLIGLRQRMMERCVQLRKAMVPSDVAICITGWSVSCL